MKHILMVDDTTTNLKVAASVLQPYYELSMAKSGKQALAFLKKKHPDLILLDIKMPDMDGYQTMERIKLDPETADIPIIFLTADTERTSEVKGLQMGALDFITKPFDEAAMLGRIEKVLMMEDLRKNLLNPRSEDNLSYDSLYNVANEILAKYTEAALLLFASVNENSNFVNEITKNYDDKLICICEKVTFVFLWNYADEEAMKADIYRIAKQYDVKVGGCIAQKDEKFDELYRNSDKSLYHIENSEGNVHWYKGL